jgi:hypothetical protein
VDAAVLPESSDAAASQEPLIPRAEIKALLARYAMPSRSAWRARPMNVLDPLQPLNNLGRSVSKASHMRIVAAMHYVGRKAQRLFVDAVRVQQVLVPTV